MNASIAYSLLEQQITGAWERLATAHPEHNVTKYTSFGGGDGTPPWRTVGFHTRVAPEIRLVCEGLHYEASPVAVIRVFREGTIDALYARKWAGDDARFLEAVASAAEVFERSLPAPPQFEQPAEDDMSWLPLSHEQRIMIQRALSPLPPPLSLAATQEA